ncbi:ROK family transcriptional regulator [Aquibacillus kalidii]|uniref:ROK family transcriptional regulator n=1 Tax=Aquibacillus kalidii TaxID=2762597 RepID=UPI001645234F|nr:ROK family transcriptional regulator [Aquibacillus kalidii]
MQRGSFQWMKSLNKSIILNEIRKNGPISRAQLAKDIKLTPPTVGSIVKELIEQGIVKESEQGTSQGGRKPTMLVINNEEFYIIGIDAGPSDLEFILSDLAGNIVTHVITEIELGITKEKFLSDLKQGITEILNKHSTIEEKIIGIGVAMHGVVDVDTGTSLFAPILNLRDIPIKEELEKEFNFTIKVENDARSLALAELWFGLDSDVSSMIAVNIGRGIGAGIIINGKLYRGENNIAGEIGHMTIDINGEKCQCGNNGCLQTVASGPAIIDKVKSELAKGTESMIGSLIDSDFPLSGELVHRAALQGDELAIKVLHDTGRFLGVGLTNLIHVFNPSKIIIGGGVSKAGNFILDPLKQTIAVSALTSETKGTVVVESKLGEHATAKGAVALLLVELFDVSNEEI